ncbi:hypothetical protein [Halarcobacter bivalviorum]|uniref:hypothetical protein n=1 Tax=Halarcobacter bivalviorum TaxID=663364 RepID=UPI0010282954|nr:hypothetical protein [Halarcobacter bivalviorum]RXK06683.1 hypothetical protein CRU97_05520 [Halarcobacter bivalviorum]
MQFIYIKNYLNIPREKKFQFMKYLYSFDEFKVINQKIILNDNALAIELDKNSSFYKAKELIDKFLQEYKEIDSFFIDSLVIEDKTLILKREDKVVRKVDLR